MFALLRKNFLLSNVFTSLWYQRKHHYWRFRFASLPYCCRYWPTLYRLINFAPGFMFGFIVNWFCHFFYSYFRILLWRQKMAEKLYWLESTSKLHKYSKHLYFLLFHWFRNCHFRDLQRNQHMSNCRMRCRTRNSPEPCRLPCIILKLFLSRKGSV